METCSLSTDTLAARKIINMQTVMERTMKVAGLLMILVAGITAATAQSAEQYVPQLGDIMNAAQVRHQKLYLAGAARNWDLAAYQSRQLRGNLKDAAVFYSGIPINNVTTLAERLNTLDAAIEAKSTPRFARAYGELTGGCNTCHQSLERAFIVIKQPSDKPFGDQEFMPKDEH
jgi:hypothetical protein